MNTELLNRAFQSKLSSDEIVTLMAISDVPTSSWDLNSLISITLEIDSILRLLMNKKLVVQLAGKGYWLYVLNPDWKTESFLSQPVINPNVNCTSCTSQNCPWYEVVEEQRTKYHDTGNIAPFCHEYR